MNDISVLPYAREGGWLSMHGFHYTCAYRSLEAFKSARLAVQSSETELAANLDDIPIEDRSGYVHYCTRNLRSNAEQNFVSSILFACMALEAFINHYGVRRLGEIYFRRNLERVGITEKFTLLLLACHHVLVANDDPTLVSLRAMFDTRNQLVHPKTREFSFDLVRQQLREPPLEHQLSEHFARLEAVIDRLCELDSHIHRGFEFSGPNAEGQGA